MDSPLTSAPAGRWLVLGPLCLLAGLGLGHWLWGGAPRATEMPGFRAAVAGARDAVVGVHCLRHPAGDDDDQRDGSGFVIHRDGLVLTNQHLIDRQLAVYVDVPERGRFLARVVGEDPVSDLAVLRLEGIPDEGLPALAFGDSDALQHGDWVITLGHPYSFSHTVTAGLVSHVGRHLAVDSIKVTNGFLQFSAAVNPGSSGGPVLDTHGAVVGVATRRHVTGEGLAFAVPSKRVRWVLARMEQHQGRVPRGYLGVGLAPGRFGGALVRTVERDGPAWRAGLRPDDHVIRFAGRAVSSAEELYDLITDAMPGSSVAIDVRTADAGEVRRLDVLLGAVATRETRTTPAATTGTGASH